MSTTKTSRHTTLQMYPGNHIPAGVISYGCKCKTLAVINRRDAAWIIKRCGRTLRADGSRVNLRVSHGELVGEHFDGLTIRRFRAVEALLRLIGHADCAIHINTEKVQHLLSIEMKGHSFYRPAGLTGVRWSCTLGQAIIRGSRDS